MDKELLFVFWFIAKYRRVPNEEDIDIYNKEFEMYVLYLEFQGYL